MKPAGGYLKKVLRVDLSAGQVKAEPLRDDLIEKYVGGTGIGAKLLYEEVPPGVEWNDPKNRLFIFSGPSRGDPDLRDRDFFGGHQRPHDQPGRMFPGQRPLWGLSEIGRI